MSKRRGKSLIKLILNQHCEEKEHEAGTKALRYQFGSVFSEYCACLQVTRQNKRIASVAYLNATFTPDPPLISRSS